MDFVPDEPKKLEFVPDKPEKKKEASSEGTFDAFDAGGAIIEPILKMVSSAVAKPVSDVAGLAATGKELVSPSKGRMGDEPQKFKESVQSALTYEPKTAGGKAEWNPLNKLPEWIGQAVGWAGDKAQQGTEAAGKRLNIPPSITGPLGSGVKEAVQQAPGFLGAKGGAKLAEGLPAKQAALDAAKKIEAPKEAIRAAAKMDKEHPYITPPEHGVKAAAAGITGKTRNEKVISKQNNESATHRFGKEVGMPEDTPLTPENIKERITEAYEGRQAMEAAVGPELKMTDTFKKNMDGALQQILAQIKHNPGVNSDMLPAAVIIRGYLKKMEPEQVPAGKILGPGGQPLIPASSRAVDASMSTEHVSSDISKLRDQAKTHFRAGDNAIAYAKLGVANQLEQLFEDNLAKTGKADLVAKFKADRVLQAKLHFIEDVVTPEGKVDLSKVASKANSKRYKGALTGELKTAADFARTWKKAAQPLTGEADPRFSVFDGMLAAGAATAAIATMDPLLMAPAGLELAGRYAIPGMAKRGMLQNAPPNYQVGPMQRAMPGAVAGLGVEASQNRGPPPQ